MSTSRHVDRPTQHGDPGRIAPAGDAPRRAVAGATFAAVLFDMDGTLISSTAAVERSWARLAEEFGIADDVFRGFAGLHGIPARSLIDRLLADRNPTERARALRRITAIEVEDTDGIAVLPGAVEALRALAPSGRAAIVTSCARDLARARLEATGLPAPATLVTADDVTAGKPDPEPFLTGAAALGLDARDCVVVEDAAAGLRSARAAGAATIGLRTTHPDGGHDADLLDADLLVADLSALLFVPVAGGVRVDLA